ncbi:hypothetical protein MKJ04_14825 [Pontibacter sp. E15-1]|uniref:hypothetical protein n=1 Tax=Pontibacter sp. E15-1 TaxID=2919918 RepID=UPI001F4FA6B8|nr:hypothetical protein [Pontibacter sp. E15-1]MCJ8166118.1 hypothetical protein [Pontibacter sp. E15-1]
MKKVLPLLAVAFSGFLVYLFDKIWGASIKWDKVKSVKVGEFLTKEIEVYQILLFLGLASLIYLIAWRGFHKGNQFYTKKQRKLREFNKTEITEASILLRWGVFFDIDTPFISDLTPYCTKHEGAPIRFIHNRCPMQGCENSKIQFNKYGMKNLIESDLIDKWEKIK